MASWPKVTRLSESLLVLLGRAVRECFWATDTSEGVSVLLDRCVGSVLPSPLFASPPSCLQPFAPCLLVLLHP